MTSKNIQSKAFDFAVRIVKLCKILKDERKEFILSNQLMRSGTSIGANLAEAQNAQSRADFLSKVNIALKEATETVYWLRLLEATEYITKVEFDSIMADCIEIEKILVASVKTMKELLSIFNCRLSISYEWRAKYVGLSSFIS